MFKSEAGFTLVELLIAALILATAVTITINVFGVNMNHASQSRNELKGSALAVSKLDEFKDYARRAGMAGAFSKITQSAVTANFNLTTNVARINDVNYTWRVEAFFSYQNGTVVADVTSNTVTSKLLRLLCSVDWKEGSDPRRLTLTTYVADVTP
jgi:prepilin-type N-terminal cleavage/methylation domain-containing protein